MKGIVMRYALAVLLLFALPCLAHDRTDSECTEAAEMVMHFAQARDTGAVDKKEAIKQYNDSLEMLSNVPPELKWFVQDQEDVDLLGKGIERVFDAPDMTPDQLNTEFKAGCIKNGKQSDIWLDSPFRRVASSQRIVPQAAMESKTMECHERGRAANHMATLILAGMSKNEFWHRHLDEEMAPEVRQELHEYVDRAYNSVEKVRDARAFQKAEFDRCMEELRL